jgi:hypothetical protein
MKAKVLVDTFAKQSSVPAKSLAANQIYPLKKGEEYEILKHSPTRSRVIVESPLLNRWVAFRPG